MPTLVRPNPIGAERLVEINSKGKSLKPSKFLKPKKHPDLQTFYIGNQDELENGVQSGAY